MKIMIHDTKIMMATVGTFKKAIDMRELMETCAGFLRLSFKANGRIYPMFHFINDSNEHKVFILQDIGSDKDFTAAVVRQILAEEKAVMLLSIFEAWSFTPKDDVDARSWFGRISEHPDRFELIHLSGESLTETLSGSIRIHRNPDGSGRLGDLEIFEPTHSEGRFAGMLPRQGVVH